MAFRLILLLHFVVLCFFHGYGSDLSLEISVNRRELEIGDTAIAKLYLKSTGGSTSSNISIQVTLAKGLTVIENFTRSGKYSIATGIWLPMQATSEMTFYLVPQVEGPLGIQIEIVAAKGPDPDSTPGNGIIGEDDLVIDYVTVPIRYCHNVPIKLGAEALQGFSGYQWYRNGQPMSGANQHKIEIVQVGRYTCRVNESYIGDKASFPVIVKHYPKLKLELGRDQTVCAGQAIRIKASPTEGSPPYTYRWENDKGLDLTAKTLKTNAVMILKVTVTDIRGCKISDSINLSVLECPLVEKNE